MQRRRRSAARWVPSRSVSGSIIRNSSPSQRTITSPLRSVRARRAPASWSTASPRRRGGSASKPSTPALTSASAWPWRVERATKRSSSRSPRRRLPRPVTGSVRPSASGSPSRPRLTASAPATAAISSPGSTGSGRQVCAPARSSDARDLRPAPRRCSTITGATGTRAAPLQRGEHRGGGVGAHDDDDVGRRPERLRRQPAVGLVALRDERAHERLVTALGDDQDAAAGLPPWRRYGGQREGAPARA